VACHCGENLIFGKNWNFEILKLKKRLKKQKKIETEKFEKTQKKKKKNSCPPSLWYQSSWKIRHGWLFSITKELEFGHGQHVNLLCKLYRCVRFGSFLALFNWVSICICALFLTLKSHLWELLSLAASY
jgi:hypothetical protein